MGAGMGVPLARAGGTLAARKCSQQTTGHLGRPGWHLAAFNRNAVQAGHKGTTSKYSLSATMVQNERGPLCFLCKTTPKQGDLKNRQSGSCPCLCMPGEASGDERARRLSGPLTQDSNQLDWTQCMPNASSSMPPPHPPLDTLSSLEEGSGPTAK